jgi:hypothetical protein
MQGKEASEQETKAKSNVGIDVSKHWLDIHVLPSNERLRVCNNCQGIRQLKRWVTRFDLALIVSRQPASGTAMCSAVWPLQRSRWPSSTRFGYGCLPRQTAFSPKRIGSMRRY